ncbi:ATP11-domain-containing protein [Leucogyrophana mollusca]|uniref:ATP11-domain-containing protein n=1 Tax=Leucogyrophana mollusca TaxID=85980 RepID=A0ACB8C199_9AGAM|nr:ATP11-domain-containing protein [Leucogyrophana mollusca]
MTFLVPRPSLLRSSGSRVARLDQRLAARVHTDGIPRYESKYAEKLQQKAKEKGLDLSELKTRAREELKKKLKEEASKSIPKAFLGQASSNSPPKTSLKSGGANATSNPGVRRDSAPVKPLGSILNVPRLLSTPHTPAQVSALWTAYHASRTGGTGRGYICASVPLDLYEKMTNVAKRYPLFVVPIPREATPDVSDADPTQGAGTAHEFYFLQWDFHDPPSPPLATEPDPFTPVSSADVDVLPQTSTVLFTPLQEYKLRTSFATPYLVLTFYTDLARTHGIVLLRGEITPSGAAAATVPGQDVSGRFLLSQVDAQVLAMGLQKFFLWGEGKEVDGAREQTAEDLLRQFHETPEDFSWEALLKHSKLTA